MTKIRKRVILALGIAMAMTLTAALAVRPIQELAEADRGTNFVIVNEIYDDASHSFNAINLTNLYTKIAGTGTYEAVRDAGTKTSQDFRNLNGGWNVSVYFGGIKWDATYLTKANNGDVILDLWRSSDTLTGGDVSQFSSSESNDYSTSTIRSFLMGDRYARFTKANAANSLTQFIAKPSQVGYQASETSDYQNDVFSSDDYLWLPSLSEADNNTIWKTDASLRAANSGVAGGYYWLRTGNAPWNKGSNAYRADVSGDVASVSVTDSYGVRPALHLNLSMAKSNTTSGARNSGKWVTVNELYDDGTHAFNASNLNDLYKRLVGAGSFDAVSSAADGIQTSYNFYLNNGGANVWVWFGGMKWDATYLTKAKNGDVILDLWRSADTLTNEKDTSKYCPWVDWGDEDGTVLYPANMYSTSYLRVVTLNAGGQYSTSNSTLSAVQAQDASNQYARFTMMGGTDSSGRDSLVPYLATSYDVGYQEKEWNEAIYGFYGSNNLSNDAYGQAEGNYSPDTDYWKRDSERPAAAQYGAWAWDYLFIPSVTEAGISDDRNRNGLWNTDASIRSGMGEGDVSMPFSRSGRNNIRNVYHFDTTGTYNNCITGYGRGVRPALHLNLSAIERNIQGRSGDWVTVGEIYNNASQTFSAANLKSLFKTLVGADTYAELKAAGTKTSQDFRDQNGGANVSVWFGGMKWDATYLTAATNGDVILDLWRSADMLTGDDASSNYSGTMSSFLMGDRYARFTRTDVANSLTQFIATPSQVGYQASESTYPDEALSSDDYLWLPSRSETITGNIWQADAFLRAATSGVGGGYCWLRSTHYSLSYYAYDLNTSGDVDYDNKSNYFGVRPALHLNLTSVARAMGSLNKDEWTGKPKTYDPDGMTWTLPKSELVTVSAAEADGWTWNGTTLTATRAGSCQLTIVPTFLWSDGSSDPVTVTYTVGKADLEAKYRDRTHPGLLEQLRETVFRSSGEHAVGLEMPSEGDPSYPVFYKGRDVTVGGLRFQYIVETHDENAHTDDQDERLNGYKETGEWKDFSELDASLRMAKDPKGYCVFFKATDPNGNYNDLYGWYAVHVAGEELTITLSSGASLLEGWEYGDKQLDRDALRDKLKEAVVKVVDAEETDETEQFKTNIANFVFYLRTEDNGGGILYTLDDEGIREGRAGELVRLPAGTYYLYATFVEGGSVSGSVVFAWANGRPHFEVSARRITLPLTFVPKAYGDDPEGWVIPGTPAHADGSGDWFAPSEDDLENLKLSYSLRAADESMAGALTDRTPAGDYTVVPACGNANYTVTFEPEGGSFAYTVEKASVLKPEADPTEYTYNGRVQTYAVRADALYEVLGDEQTDANEAGYTVTVRLRDGDNYKWKDGDSGDLFFTFIIHRMEISADWGGGSYVYTGSALPYPTAAADGADGALLSLVIAPSFEGAFQNAGSYTFLASLDPSDAASKNYLLTGGTERSYTVEKAPLTVTANDNAIVYGEAPVHGGVAYSGFVGEDDEHSLGGALAFTYGYERYQNVGDYLITPGGLTSGNYEIDFVAGTLTVSPLEISADWGGENYVYTGSALAYPTATAGGVHGDVFTLLIAPSFEGAFQNAGSYTFRASLDPSDVAAKNYLLTGGTERSYTIEKAVYDLSGVRFEGGEWDYDGQAHSLFITGDLPDGVSVTYEGNAQKDTGEYTVTAVFAGDADNFESIPSMTALLTIYPVSHDLSGISFGDVTVSYDGEAHEIVIRGILPRSVSVSYEGNGQTEAGVYTVTAVFRDLVEEFARQQATLTILRTHASATEEGGEEPTVVVDVEGGFDPTCDFAVAEAQDVERTLLAWGKDTVSKIFTVKLIKDGEELPFEGRALVRLLIPEEFRDREFSLTALVKDEVSSVAKSTAQEEGTHAVHVDYTRDGDYIVFEADGLSSYILTSEYASTIPIVFVCTSVLFADVAVLAVLLAVVRRNKKKA